MIKVIGSSAVLAAAMLVSTAAFGQQSSKDQSGQWRDLQFQSQYGQQRAQSDQGRYQQQQYGQAQQAGAQQGQLSQIDQVFLKSAWEDIQAETQLLQAAKDQSQSQRIKDLAQQMLKDHQTVKQQIQQVAQQNGVKLSDQLSPLKQQQLDAIKSLKGQQFDQQFLSANKAAHLEAVSKYGDVAQLSQNQSIRQLAQTLLPDFRHHLRVVMQASRDEGLPGPMPAGARMGPEQGMKHGHMHHGGSYEGSESK
jgi:putative membrane protein